MYPVSNRPFSRAVGSKAALGVNPSTHPSGADRQRLEPLRSWWNGRTRLPTAHVEAMDYRICAQIADAVIYVKDPRDDAWLHYARLSRLPGWQSIDIQHPDDVVAAAQAAGIDVDSAMGVVMEANVWLMAHPWKLDSPTLAAAMESRAKAAWVHNCPAGTSEAGLVMWVWLTAALLDLDWDVTPCTWAAREQVPRSAAMAHVAGRVIGRSVRPGYLNRLLGELGSCAFALQLVATQWQCGLGSHRLCQGDGAPCPLVGTCHAYAERVFPFAGD